MITQEQLAGVVEVFLLEVQQAFTVNSDLASIKTSTTKLREMLRVWDAHNKQVRSVIIGLLDLVTARCKHVGAQTGYNERDGSWMNACPTCGATR